MKKLGYLIPGLIICISLSLIGICLGLYFSTEDTEYVRYVYQGRDNPDTDTNKPKYKLVESTVEETEEVENTNSDAQDVSELEQLIETLNKQAAKENVINP